MSDLYIFSDKNGMFKLCIDTGSKSCGESRSDWTTIKDGFDLKEAKRLVDSSVARWRGSPPVCSCCGRPL